MDFLLLVDVRGLDGLARDVIEEGGDGREEGHERRDERDAEPRAVDRPVVERALRLVQRDRRTGGDDELEEREEDKDADDAGTEERVPRERERRDEEHEGEQDGPRAREHRLDDDGL